MKEYIERTLPVEWVKKDAYIAVGKGTAECKWVAVKGNSDDGNIASVLLANGECCTLSVGTMIDVLIPSYAGGEI